MAVFDDVERDTVGRDAVMLNGRTPNNGNDGRSALDGESIQSY